MDGAIQPILDLLLAQGMSGIVIIGLAYICNRFYARNLELTETLITMTRETVKAQEAATDAINRLADLLRSRPSAG